MNDYSNGELLALDPGLNKPGVALFRGGKLVAAERVKIDRSYAHLPFGERCVRVAADIMRWGMGHNMSPRTFVYERPQIYDSRAGKGKGDPNDLLGLVGVASAVAGQLSLAMAMRDVCLSVLSPTPAEWIGQLPKIETGDPWASPRGIRVRSRISTEEFTSILPSHDAVDATGIGLWAMGRLDIVRVLPGAV